VLGLAGSSDRYYQFETAIQPSQHNQDLLE
jgi:hypothetical protein